jgi:Calcium-activated chloride channel
MELFIQLAIIMVGKQIFNTILEMGMPWAKKKYRIYKLKTPQRNVPLDLEFKTYSQWAKDYKLIPWHSMSLFQEYLEMILQFG